LGHAYLWLAWGSYLPSHEAFPEARRHALRALELKPELAYAHAIMGSVRLWYDWDWPGSLEDLERAVSISPSEAGAYLDLGWWHTVAGHFDRGIRYAEKAVELDPLNLEYHIDLADFHRLARRYEAALEMSRAVQQLYPDNSETHWIEGMIHYNQKNYRKAERAFQQASRLSEGQTWAQLHLAMAMAKAGKEDEARVLLSELRSRPRQTAAAPVEFAMAYLALNERATALNLLEQAYQIRANWLISIKVDPVWDPLRGEPRFQALVKQMGFPE
jgi:serine/threonine-protein kinase